jgi:uncharacterized damage-inducible protein DinB
MGIMSVPVETLRTHLRYTEWASRRLVRSAASLTEEELHRDFKHSDKSVLGTLVHIFAADRIWIQRVKGTPISGFIDPVKDFQMTVLENEWPAIHQQWQELAAGLSDGAVEHRIQYRDLKGNSYETPLWQIILHVVNHATHHRGQVSAMIRAMGHTPPPVDLIFYYRELAK